uniref:50S ribosomal protein L20 n=1 Tax=Gronococcus sybilensis TaxID=3028029 RepID=A0A9Y1I2M8_9RHOD|nr:ribosomal protein L20 [Gronococcus sybilensis]
MVRVKRGNVARKRRKKVLRLAKGFRSAHSKLFSAANQQVMKSLKYNYVGRKRKKRELRNLWVVRINATVRQNAMKYSELMHYLKLSNIKLNRKMLASIAILDPEHFTQILQKVK